MAEPVWAGVRGGTLRTAGHCLRQCGLDVDSVLVRVRPVAPDRFPVRSAPAWMRRLWNPGVSAMTLPWAIYVRPEALQSGGRDLGRLVVHELVHARQWRELGWLRFGLRYLREYFRGRRGGLNHWEAYRNISLEREARELEGRAVS